MSLIPWSRKSLTPFQSNMENWMEELFGGNGPELSRLPRALRGGFAPPVNVAETDQALIATVELPGMDEEDIRVQVLGGQLIVSGERKWEQEKKDKEFHRVESQYGSFHRSITLPPGLVSDAEAIEATFKKGVLEVRVPKAEPKAATKVKVKTK